MKLVKFGAEWCGPCRMLDPQLKKLLADDEFSPEIVLVDIDEEPEPARDYRIMSVPTMVLFSDDGEELHRMVGVKSAAKIKEDLLPFME